MPVLDVAIDGSDEARAPAAAPQAQQQSARPCLDLLLGLLGSPRRHPQVDGDLNLVKGRGGALLREKARAEHRQGVLWVS